MSLKGDLLRRGIIDRSDIAIASFLECGVSSPQNNKIHSYDSLQNLSYLSLLASRAYRFGHSALPLSYDAVRDLIEELFFSEDGDDDSLEPICMAVMNEISNECWMKWIWKIPPFIDSGHLPLPFSLYDEEFLAEHIFRLASVSEISSSKISHSYQDSSLFQALNVKQQKAVINAISHPFSIISGGPGTGKTHTAGVAIALMTERYCVRRRTQHEVSFPPYRILVAAPTGKAVYNLNASIRSALSRYKNDLQIMDGDYIIEAKTLHKYVWDQRSGSAQGSYHVMIVDECSMIDTKMMADVFALTQTGTRIILLGDPYQLPPIDPGKPFSDLVLAASSLSTIAYSHLVDCVRTESKTILDLAHSVLSGNEEQFIHILNESCASSELNFLPIEEKKSFHTACSYLEDEVVKEWENVSSIEKGLEVSTSKKILTSAKRGAFISVDSLNRAVVHALSTKRSKRDMRNSIEPVLITRNKYQLDCMNGDIGIIEGRWDPELHQKEETIHLAWKKENGSFPASLCPERELGYAMTVHKSQGSEFSHVFFFAGEKCPLLTRELLYTAITRAKKKLTMIGSKEALLKAVRSPSYRCSVFPSILKRREEEILKRS